MKLTEVREQGRPRDRKAPTGLSLGGYGLLQSHATRHEDGGADEIDLTGMSGEEIRLIPKASSTGAEGTIFYSSSDKCIYVGKGT